jgi:hypothetical protein
MSSYNITVNLNLADRAMQPWSDGGSPIILITSPNPGDTVDLHFLADVAVFACASPQTTAWVEDPNNPGVHLADGTPQAASTMGLPGGGPGLAFTFSFTVPATAPAQVLLVAKAICSDNSYCITSEIINLNLPPGRPRRASQAQRPAPRD